MSASAFKFRMGAGFAGDVNRAHPFAVLPGLIDPTSPPTKYGMMTLVDATSHKLRKFVAGDQSDSVDATPYGAMVRPYPFQQPQASVDYAAAAFGDATPPTSGPGDFLVNGMIMVKLNANVAAPVKGGRVYVWAAATSGDHIQGGYETAASGSNTTRLDARYSYNGPADADGVVEILCNV